MVGETHGSPTGPLLLRCARVTRAVASRRAKPGSGRNGGCTVERSIG